MIYQCIAMHSISIHVLIQLKEYQFIDISMYRCVLINELFSAMDKTLNLIFYRKQNLVQYGDGHGFIAT